MKIKLTKTELKAQKDALARFQRFLPMLQLKKQQLQAEIAQLTARIEDVRSHRDAAETSLQNWVELFADPEAKLDGICTLTNIEVESGNIAGVRIPVFKGVTLDQPPQDPFLTPAWVDDAQEQIGTILTYRAEAQVLEEQRRLINEELLMTSQRVNLFEKVKIPECKENIRVISIALGDEQTASVVRGKISKSRNVSQSEDGGDNGEAA